MKPFRFNLEAVLRQRKFIYEQKAKEFALAIHQLELEQGRLSDIRRRQSETTSAFQAKKQRGLTVRDSALYLSYLDRLSDEEQAHITVVEAAESRVRAVQEALEDARVQSEIMEKLKEKSRTVYNDQLRREEQQSLDEVSTTRYKSPSNPNSSI